MKSGSIAVLYLNKSIKNFPEFFKDVDYFVPEKLFTHNLLTDEKFYKPLIVKPEEDEDYLGNKGFFKAKKEFALCVLLNIEEENLEKLF